MVTWHIIESVYFRRWRGDVARSQKILVGQVQGHDNNMCVMALRCLFIDTDDGESVDAGIGNKRDHKLKFYHLTARCCAGDPK